MVKIVSKVNYQKSFRDFHFEMSFESPNAAFAACFGVVEESAQN